MVTVSITLITASLERHRVTSNLIFVTEWKTLLSLLSESFTLDRYFGEVERKKILKENDGRRDKLRNHHRCIMGLNDCNSVNPSFFDIIWSNSVSLKPILHPQRLSLLFYFLSVWFQSELLSALTVLKPASSLSHSSLHLFHLKCFCPASYENGLHAQHFGPE